MDREVRCACGATFTTKSSRARFCSSTCRSRAYRGGERPLAPVPAPGEPAAEATPVKPLVATVEKKLRAADRLDTPAGQMALVLAERLAAGLDTGSALATLSKQLTLLLEDALAGAKVEPDALDELAERRLKKVAGG